MNELAECHRRGRKMREKFKEIFPEKSGEISGWKFGKFHAVENCIVTIIFWGWIETTPCQSGERGCKALLKCFAGIHNNRQVFRQFLSYWERAEQLSRAKNDFEEDEINQVCEEETREEAMHSCKLGVRCPLFSWLLTDMTNISGQLIGRELVLIAVINCSNLFADGRHSVCGQWHQALCGCTR